MVFNHKTEGKLALDWVSKVNDDYIYATIPENFDDIESSVFQQAKVAGEEIVQKAGSEIVRKAKGKVIDKVLDKFSELIGKID